MAADLEPPIPNDSVAPSGTKVLVQQLVTKFNEVVHANAIKLKSAPWYTGTLPADPTNPQLGDPDEPAMTTDYFRDWADKGVLTTRMAFNILHSFAMEMTRVRLAESFFFAGSPIQLCSSGQEHVALDKKLAIYFPMPPVAGGPGSVLSGKQVSEFLDALSAKVNEIRDGVAYKHLFMTGCHSSCHSSCHGSRGRR